MTSDRTALATIAVILCGLSTSVKAFATDKPDAANPRLGTVRLLTDNTLQFRFRDAPASNRKKFANVDVFSHDGVRYEGQSLKSLVDWLSRRHRPTPALLFATADIGDVQKTLETDNDRIDKHGLVFVPRTSPRPVPKPNPASETESEVLRLVNAARRQYGLQPLALCPKLCAASRSHSITMASYRFFSHTSPVAGHYYFTDRARAHGATAWSENIAMHGGGASGAVQMWLNSPAHRANMLNPGARSMGIGHSGGYWTQMFGN